MRFYLILCHQFAFYTTPKLIITFFLFQVFNGKKKANVLYPTNLRNHLSAILAIIIIPISSISCDIDQSINQYMGDSKENVNFMSIRFFIVKTTLPWNDIFRQRHNVMGQNTPKRQQKSNRHKI